MFPDNPAAFMRNVSFVSSLDVLRQRIHERIVGRYKVKPDRNINNKCVLPRANRPHGHRSTKQFQLTIGISMPRPGAISTFVSVPIPFLCRVFADKRSLAVWLLDSGAGESENGDKRA